MILEQYYLTCLSHASYLLADEKAGVAAIVDPQRDVDRYLADAAARGLRIEHVFLTHFHADFVSGHLALRARTGATIHLGAAGKAEYPHHALADGDEVAIGALQVRALATPGHTPESTCYLVFPPGAKAKAKQPQAVFTGDTLFVGDVGRPDLMVACGLSAEQLGGKLYDSLHRKLLTLPDATVVYPAHGAGSMCGKSLGKETHTTIGIQRAHNYALAPMSKEAFVRLVTADQPEAPAYFGVDARLNREERPVLESTLKSASKPLSLARVLARAKAGATLLDTRDQDEYHQGHLAGSLNIGLDGKFASWAGTVLDLGAPLLVIADPGREGEAIMRLGRIGFDRVEGYLEGGFAAAAAAAPARLARTVRITPAALAAARAGGKGPAVLDIRGPGEWQEAHLEGAVHIPLPQLRKRLAEVPKGRPLVVHCQGGYRSSLALGLLAAAGLRDLQDLEGGMGAWLEAGLPTHGEGSACASAAAPAPKPKPKSARTSGAAAPRRESAKSPAKAARKR